MIRRRRASARIALVLVGVGGVLVGCSPQGSSDRVRDRYASLEDCAADWGRPEACEAEGNASPAAQGAGGRSHLFLGPSYFAGGRRDAQRTSWDEARQLGRTTSPGSATDRSIARVPSATQRGGFGSTGARLSAGG